MSLKCRIGLHNWKHFRDISPFVTGEAVSFGGYVFLPSTKRIEVCTVCGTRRETITNHKGEVIRRV
jgi:hypothetical protein